MPGSSKPQLLPAGDWARHPPTWGGHLHPAQREPASWLQSHLVPQSCWDPASRWGQRTEAPPLTGGGGNIEQRTNKERKKKKEGKKEKNLTELTKHQPAGFIQNKRNLGGREVCPGPGRQPEPSFKQVQGPQAKVLRAGALARAGRGQGQSAPHWESRPLRDPTSPEPGGGRRPVRQGASSSQSSHSPLTSPAGPRLGQLT